MPTPGPDTFGDVHLPALEAALHFNGDLPVLPAEQLLQLAGEDGVGLVRVARKLQFLAVEEYLLPRIVSGPVRKDETRVPAALRGNPLFGTVSSPGAGFEVSPHSATSCRRSCPSVEVSNLDTCIWDISIRFAISIWVMLP
ncbi:MAG: hypothetical protein V7646_3928 [Pseudonocardia sp.]|jgi:hypothetical protein